MKFLSILSVVMLAACSGRGGQSAGLSGSDSLVINFNRKASNTIEKTISTTEKNAIKKLARFMDGKQVSEFKCGYDGNIIFYKKSSIAADVSFNFSNDSCHHFIQLINGKLTTMKMSNEAADFLRSLSEGKNWY